MESNRLRVLVTYGSERGATAEIAGAIAETLLNERFDVDLRPAQDVKGIDHYDAVIIGGALYMGHWQRDARRFVKRYAAALRERAVYMFSSGPLDTSAIEHDLPPPPSVARLVHAAGARAHVTFGGRLARDAEGFIASQIAKTRAGDWRSWHRIRAWAHEVADALRTAPARTTTAVSRGASGRWLLALSCFLVGIAALAGGSRLAGILCIVIGIGSLVAGIKVTSDASSGAASASSPDCSAASTDSC